MRHGFVSVLIAPFLLLLTIVTTPAFAQQRTLCVHGIEAPSSLQVRSGPGLTNGVIGSFPAKACGIKLVGSCSGDWCQMALGKTDGWVLTKHIAVYELPGKPAEPAASVAAEVGEPTPQRASERSAPPQRVAKAEVPPVLRPAPPGREPETEQGSKASKESSKERNKDLGACVTGVDDDDTLRIRRGPGVRHDEIGALPPSACGIKVTDKCRGSWCRVAWRGRSGWVNTYYLD